MALQILKRVAAAAAFALTCAGAQAGLYSDLWYDPREPGWGLNVVQQDETAFVTLFVYDAQRKPTWLVASDASVIAYAGTMPIFAGTLYRTEGSPHSAPHAPPDLTPVGEVSLELVSRNRMRVHYRVDGAAYVKEVVRQTFAETPVTGNYLGHFYLRQSRPGEPPYGASIYHGEMLLLVDSEGTAILRVTDHLSRQCDYRGPYVQEGKLARFAGTFTCSGGDALSGTFEVTDLEASAHGVSAALRMNGSGILQLGRFAAVRW